MKNRVPQFIVRSLLVLCLSGPALAVIVPWQLTGSFADMATVTGRFDFDTDTSTFSNSSFETGPGSFAFATELLGRRYDNITQVIPGTPFGIRFLEIEPLGGIVENQYNLWIAGFDPAVPIASNVALNEAVLLILNSPGKPSGIAQNRSGDGFVQVIPEPEIYALMVAGLGLVGGLASRRKSKTRITPRSARPACQYT